MNQFPFFQTDQNHLSCFGEGKPDDAASFWKLNSEKCQKSTFNDDSGQDVSECYFIGSRKNTRKTSAEENI